MIYLNGQFISLSEAKIEPTDRGFLLSDGIFETMRIYQGKPFALKEHWSRLTKSAETLELPHDLTYEKLENIINKLLNINALGGG
jgi:branched-subunit amino acid aminotransferase/4-amino-4-deoxychorismate lyase